MNKIDGKRLIEYLETYFNKNIKLVTIKDLSTITAIPIQGIKDENNEYAITIEEALNIFPNLKALMITNLTISQDIVNYLQLRSIHNVTLTRCTIPVGLSFDLSLTELSIINCTTEDYKFLETLADTLLKLEIINPKDETEFDSSILKKHSLLREVTLIRCILTNDFELATLINCDTLSLLWTDLTNNGIQAIKELPLLKRLYISEKYNDKLNDITKSIDIKNDLIEFGFDKEEPSKKL